MAFVGSWSFWGHVGRNVVKRNVAVVTLQLIKKNFDVFGGSEPVRIFAPEHILKYVQQHPKPAALTVVLTDVMCRKVKP